MQMSTLDEKICSVIPVGAFSQEKIFLKKVLRRNFIYFLYIFKICVRNKVICKIDDILKQWMPKNEQIKQGPKKMRISYLSREDAKELLWLKSWSRKSQTLAKRCFPAFPRFLTRAAMRKRRKLTKEFMSSKMKC